MSRVVWLDGRLTTTDATADRRPCGLGAFTTAGCDHGRPLFWDRHRSRLGASLEHLGAPALELPSQGAMSELLAADGRHGPARLRLKGWRTEDGWRLEASAADPGPVGPDAPPLNLAVLRWPGEPPPAGHKTLARQAWDRAASAARAAGADDALLVDDRGRLLETAVANLWLAHGPRLLTPPAPGRCLPGIMRGWLLEHAAEAGLAAAARDLTLDDLGAADEVWVSNAVVGLRRVARVDARTWGAWPVFDRLAALALPAPAWPRP